MTYRLPSERILVELPDGPSVEVERLAAWPLYRAALFGMSKWDAAATPDAEYVALRGLAEWFIAEAQPTFDVADHRGRIAQTIDGLLRLPRPLFLAWYTAWLETHIPKASAVDATVPPGPLRDELNARLRRKRAA